MSNHGQTRCFPPLSHDCCCGWPRNKRFDSFSEAKRGVFFHCCVPPLSARRGWRGSRLCVYLVTGKTPNCPLQQLGFRLQRCRTIHLSPAVRWSQLCCSASRNGETFRAPPRGPRCSLFPMPPPGGSPTTLLSATPNFACIQLQPLFCGPCHSAAILCARWRSKKRILKLQIAPIQTCFGSNLRVIADASTCLRFYGATWILLGCARFWWLRIYFNSCCRGANWAKKHVTWLSDHSANCVSCICI